MRCSACATENDAGRKFCQECGSRLLAACPECGTANGADAKFCGECGSPLRETPARAPDAETPARSSTERRVVSVMFADLVDSTLIATDRDAEEVRSIQQGYFQVGREAVERHGGRVEKFIGDAVMAVWGAPVSHEDDAERAVRAALEMVDAVAALGRHLGTPLLVRAGVLTGEAAADLAAVDQGIVTGDLVNVAARLQSAAEPGTVLVGETTRRAADASISFEPVGALALKGKPEPVPAWRAVRVVGERGGVGRGSAPEPPFVGRDEDLRLIKELLHVTGRERQPRLVAVTGVAGIGKSRLVWELQKYVDGLTETIYWHQGRCPAYGEGIAFWALAEMVRMRARIAETDDAEQSRDRLERSLEEYVPDGEERHWLLPRLAHLLGLSDAPEGGREELFAAWRRFFERVADQGTCVLVVEDLQWADPGMLDFVESLLTWTRAAPILVVTLARPEIDDRRPTWGSAVRSLTSLHLAPLPDPAMAALVSGYVDGLPGDALERVVSRAEGVPLYAVETVRMLADRGALERSGDHYQVVGDLGRVDVPETLHSLVAARLDALPPEQRSLVQDASVLGHSFQPQGLAVVSGRSEDDLAPLLADLVRREVLERDVDPRSPERGQVAFVQEVIREVAYSTLAKSDRRAKHLAVARWFESLSDEDLAGAVASHYLDAYLAEPAAADAEAVAADALAWLTRAADRAMSLGSPQAALAHSEQALRLTVDGLDRARQLAQIATAAAYLMDVERSWEATEEAVSLFAAAGEVVESARLLTAVARPVAHRQREAVSELLRALTGRLDDEPLALADVLACLADLASSAGDDHESLALSERALGLAEMGDDPVVLGHAAEARAFALFNAGRHWECALLAGGALDLARRGGSTLSLARTTTSYGVLMSEDDRQAGLAAFTEAAELARRAGIGPLLLVNLGNVAESAADLGRWDLTDRYLADLAEHDPPAAQRAFGTYVAAMVRAMKGDALSGLAELTELDRPRDDYGSLQEITWYLRARSVVQLMAGRAAEAWDDARGAISIEPSGANAGNAAWAAVVAAAVLRDVSKVEDAVSATASLRGRWIDAVRRTAAAASAGLAGDADAGALAQGALDRWDELGQPLDHAWAAVVAAYTLPDDGQPVEHRARAREFLGSIGGHGMLSLLDEAGG